MNHVNQNTSFFSFFSLGAAGIADCAFRIRVFFVDLLVFLDKVGDKFARIYLHVGVLTFDFEQRITSLVQLKFKLSNQLLSALKFTLLRSHFFTLSGVVFLELQ